MKILYIYGATGPAGLDGGRNGTSGMVQSGVAEVEHQGVVFK
jgi:hypothetical protein